MLWRHFSVGNRGLPFRSFKKRAPRLPMLMPTPTTRKPSANYVWSAQPARSDGNSNSDLCAEKTVARCHLLPPSSLSVAAVLDAHDRQPCSPQEASSAYPVGLSTRRRPRPSSLRLPLPSPGRHSPVFPSSSSALLSLVSPLPPPPEVSFCQYSD